MRVQDTYSVHFCVEILQAYTKVKVGKNKYKNKYLLTKYSIVLLYSDLPIKYIINISSNICCFTLELSAELDVEQFKNRSIDDRELTVCNLQEQERSRIVDMKFPTVPSPGEVSSFAFAGRGGKRR
jgi:hypothetical protein